VITRELLKEIGFEKLKHTDWKGEVWYSSQPFELDIWITFDGKDEQIMWKANELTETDLLKIIIKSYQEYITEFANSIE